MATISMKVVKRNGELEDVSFDKVLRRIQIAADGLEVNSTLIAQRTLLRIYDNVKTSELDELAAQLSISLITTNPDYGILASRIAISNHATVTMVEYQRVTSSHPFLTTMTVEEFENKSQEESSKTVNLFVSALGVDEEIAGLLLSHGFSSLEEIAYVPMEELLAIDGFDEEIVDALRSRANDTLLAQALASNAGADDLHLSSIPGMTTELIEQLKTIGVTNMDELAEQSIDELLVLPAMTEEQAGKLMMKARERWFAEDASHE